MEGWSLIDGACMDGLDWIGLDGCLSCVGLAWLSSLLLLLLASEDRDLVGRASLLAR